MARLQQRGSTLYELLILFIWLAVIYGYFANIVRLIAVHTVVDTTFILRVVGLFAVPVGVIMGYIPNA